MTTEQFIERTVPEARQGSVGGQSVYFIPCPGAECHTKPTQPNDCYIGITSFEERWMYCHCFHTSCEESRKSYIKKLNKQYIRQLPHNNTGKVTIAPRTKPNVGKARQVFVANETRAKVEPITPPAPIFSSPKVDTEYFYKLWQPDDIIWVGKTEDSAPDHFHFAKDRPAPMPFTCGSTFHAFWRRRKLNVKYAQYIVLEGDNSPKDKQWGLLKHIDAHYQPMIMCVDSGGKSLHGWFERTKWMVDNEAYLTTLGFDPKTMRVAQPVRFPGAYREEKGNYQRIIYATPLKKVDSV